MLRPHISVLRIPVTTRVTESPVPHSRSHLLFRSHLTLPLHCAHSRLSPFSALTLSGVWILIPTTPFAGRSWPRPLTALTSPPRPSRSLLLAHIAYELPATPTQSLRPAPPLTALTPFPAPPSRSPRSCPSRSLQALPPAKGSPVPAPGSPTDDVHVLKADAAHTPALHGPG